MKVFFLIVISLSLSFKSAASFWYKELEFISIENFSANRGAEKIYITFDYIINNPNWYNVTIKPSQLNLKIAEADCGDVLIVEKVNIKRKTKAAYRFSLQGDSNKFLRSSFSSIYTMLSKGKIDFLLTGDLKAGVFGIAKKWKMDYTYGLTLEEFMSFF
ncbi:MAG: hypothetical protein AB8B72_01250 [Crocinitomicaceae bacterium]